VVRNRGGIAVATIGSAMGGAIHSGIHSDIHGNLRNNVNADILLYQKSTVVGH
jgi:hypothetical protein